MQGDAECIVQYHILLLHSNLKITDREAIAMCPEGTAGELQQLQSWHPIKLSRLLDNDSTAV